MVGGLDSRMRRPRSEHPIGGAADQLRHRRVDPARDNAADDRHEFSHLRGVPGPGQRRRGDTGDAFGLFEQRRRHPGGNVARHARAEPHAGILQRVGRLRPRQAGQHEAPHLGSANVVPAQMGNRRDHSHLDVESTREVGRDRDRQRDKPADAGQEPGAAGQPGLRQDQRPDRGLGCGIARRVFRRQLLGPIETGQAVERPSIGPVEGLQEGRGEGAAGAARRPLPDPGADLVRGAPDPGTDPGPDPARRSRRMLSWACMWPAPPPAAIGRRPFRLPAPKMRFRIDRRRARMRPRR